MSCERLFKSKRKIHQKSGVADFENAP